MSAVRKDNRFITIDGETKTLAEWAQEYGISHRVILGRLAAGWDEERAITQPARKYGRKQNNESTDQGQIASD